MNNKLGIGVLIILLILLFGCKNGVMAQIIKNDELKQMQNISKMNFDENIVMLDLANRKVKLNSGYYMPTQKPKLYDKITAIAYDENISIRDSNIRNGTELILL